MQEQESAIRQCPFCMEEIKADAVRCMHCQAAFAPEKPTHEGVCPFCKENINPEAIRCMYCKADLAPAEQYSGRQERFPMRLVTYRQTPGPTLITRRRVEQPGSGYPDATRPLPRSAPRGCNDYEIDDEGTWCFIEASEHYCIYEQC
jgi:hypothetical protein